MNKTPNALPPTMITLGEQFGNTALSLDAARNVRVVSFITIGSKQTKSENGTKYPYHLIDLEGQDGIIARSRELRINKKQLRTLMRATIRKIAVFVFENQSR